MAITGKRRWYLAVLIGNREFKWFTIERDEAEIAALMTAEADFWELVKTDTPPAADGTRATTEALTTIYSESNDSVCDLTAFSANLRQYMAMKKQINELEQLAEEAANKIREFMGESCGGECDGFKVSWKSQTRSTFDRKRFESENPDIDLSGYFKKSVARPFKVTEIKN
jgi:predicted phage-related endonuclease